MRYRRAVEKLRELADACDAVKGRSLEGPLLLEAYVFGDVLEGAEAVDAVEVALVLDLPLEEVPWESHPRSAELLADQLRLGKGGFAYWWRPRREPVGNHHIRGPVRFWSHDGPDEEVFQVLAERRFDVLARSVPSVVEQRRQLASDLAGTLARLRAVHDAYWNREWRREHRGFGRYPENRLWEAVHGYLDVLDASEKADPERVDEPE